MSPYLGQANELEVGQKVRFDVSLNQRGMPQAGPDCHEHGRVTLEGAGEKPRALGECVILGVTGV